MIRKIRKRLLAIMLEWHWHVIRICKKRGQKLLLKGHRLTEDEFIRMTAYLTRHSVRINRLNALLDQIDTGRYTYTSAYNPEFDK